MKFEEAIRNLLQDYQVDWNRGFLPKEDPLKQLPAAFQAWEDLAIGLAQAIQSGEVRKQIEKLVLIESPQFSDQAEMERAMLLLSFFGHAYIHAMPAGPKKLPASISKPWVNIAKQLGRKAILSHASVVLNNWQRVDPSKGIELDNLKTLMQFNATADEAWFYLVTVVIEQVGAKGIPLLLEIIELVGIGEIEKALDGMDQLRLVFTKLQQTLIQIYERVDPAIFYRDIRPFLASFEQVEYLGTELGTQSFHGGSAAQSSLLQFFDCALGMNYEQDKRSQDYLLLMRAYMPPKHAQFLSFVEAKSNLRALAKKNPTFGKAYQGIVDQLIEFRNEHLKLVALYIMKPAAQMQKSTEGTGGTNPLLFLKSIRDRNKELNKKTRN